MSAGSLQLHSRGHKRSRRTELSSRLIVKPVKKCHWTTLFDERYTSTMNADETPSWSRLPTSLDVDGMSSSTQEVEEWEDEGEDTVWSTLAEGTEERANFIAQLSAFRTADEVSRMIRILDDFIKEEQAYEQQ